MSAGGIAVSNQCPFHPRKWTAIGDIDKATNLFHPLDNGSCCHTNIVQIIANNFQLDRLCAAGALLRFLDIDFDTSNIFDHYPHIFDDCVGFFALTPIDKHRTDCAY